MVSALESPSLVLNRNWQPVNIAPAGEALSMIYRDVAQAVNTETYELFDWEDWSALKVQESDRFIQAVRFRVLVPDVIVLRSFNRLPTSIVTFSRRNIFKRDNYTCQFCNKQPGSEELTIDHVVPRAQGGESTWENCVLSCVECNSKKGNRTPTQAGMPLKKKPVRPSWEPLYASHPGKLDSWKKFLSEAYWTVKLEK